MMIQAIIPHQYLRLSPINDKVIGFYVIKGSFDSDFLIRVKVIVNALFINDIVLVDCRNYQKPWFYDRAELEGK